MKESVSQPYLYVLGPETYVCRDVGVEDITDTQAGAGAGAGTDRCAGSHALLE